MRHIILAAGLVLAAPPAMAHAFLKTATPAVGATVSQAPPEIVIDFTEGVEPSFSSITVQDASGARVDSGSVHLAGGDTHLAIALGKLSPGVYKVTWHATATDTHKTEGSYSFVLSH